jgi:hypothetical protein
MLNVLKEEEEMLKEKEETKEQNDALIKNTLKEKNEEMHDIKEMMEHIEYIRKSEAMIVWESEY